MRKEKPSKTTKSGTKAKNQTVFSIQTLQKEKQQTIRHIHSRKTQQMILHPPEKQMILSSEPISF